MWIILKSLLNLLQYCFCFFMFCFFDPKAWGTLTSLLGIEPVPLALEGKALMHWTTMEVCKLEFFL